MSITSTEAATGAAVIGPNAITRMAQALTSECGGTQCREIFAAAGLARHLTEPPTRMVPEIDVARLHRVAVERLGELQAALVSRLAGRLTGDYLLSNRIPRLAQRVLKMLPRSLASRILAAAIERHAWTFVGSGAFSYDHATGFRLRIAGSPVCKELHTREPACSYFAATFERVFGEIIGDELRVHEVECEATGGKACVFELRW
ncbi:MAG: bacteriochlorophyll 4-vinyl reductase [Methylocystis sp.]|nr:MAG: bacteriochlorophyll 4-vinyl reductase [Methylocystis sp.]